ncbi:hypothetical protein TNCV_2369531 [Trichonephila clavipes]|nr:hypothetical protein TNCV_2369531 [Trichonephila clavipes]
MFECLLVLPLCTRLAGQPLSLPRSTTDRKPPAGSVLEWFRNPSLVSERQRFSVPRSTSSFCHYLTNAASFSRL